MFFTVSDRTDGFGGQFQTIICCILLAENTGNEYIHNNIRCIEHNYDNDPEYISKVESLMNIIGNYKSRDELELTDVDVVVFTPQEIIYNFEKNMNILMRSESLVKLKSNFWKNKNRNFFNNDAINIAIHIRRPNPHDNREDGANTHLKYYFDIIESLKKTILTDKQLIFHIYSQNEVSDYDEFGKEGLCFHLNESLFDTFTGLVAADILVTSRSSLSYSAAILSDGLILYQPFWHPPDEKWIIC
jgi:hypothetical protein